MTLTAREKKRERNRRWREANPSYHREWEQANPEKRLEQRRRWRANNRDKALEANRRYSEANPEKLREATRRWREANRDKQRAHDAVARALKSGRLQKPERCESCGEATLLNGHHEDYGKALDVQWLCHDCHARRHRKDAA